MPRSEIPPGLGDAFGVGPALRAGVSRSRLRASDLERTFHGARAIVGTETGDEPAQTAYPRSAEVKRIHERARHYTVVMARAAFFSHITAAALWDAPIPGHLFRARSDHKPAMFDPEVLEVSVLWPARAPRGSGVNGHAIRPGLASSLQHPVSGLHVADPATTWATLAGRLRHPYDLIAVADHFTRIPRAPHGRPWVKVRSPHATIAELTAAVAAGRRVGVAQLREAVARVRTGASSRPETWTRLTLVDAGLPEPVLDYDVVDDHGDFLACVDMAYPPWRIAIEYEGVHHGSGTQWESDIDRYARLEAAGWRVIRVTRRMLFQLPEQLVQRVRAAIADRTR